jgi:hypothetical protein
MNSRSKGKRGELEFAKYIVERFDGINIEGEPVTCRRGQQFCGGQDSPDVVTNLPCHFEVKRTSRLRLYEAVEQAVRDGGDKAVVAHRANHKPWLAILPMDVFLNLLADRIGECNEK